MHNKEDFTGLLTQPTTSAKWVRGLCPYHEDSSPSLFVYDDGFHCFGCGANGPLDLLYDTLAGVVPGEWVRTRLDRKPRSWERVDWPASEEIVDWVYTRHSSLKTLVQVHWYLEQRGVASLIDFCQMGWDNGWYILPVYNHKFSFDAVHDTTIVRPGIVHGVVARACPATARKTGMRFDMPENQKPMMYMPYWYDVHKCKDRLYVVYGIMDALALAVLGQPVVTTTAGQASFKPEWLNKCDRPIYIIPDKWEDKEAYKLAAKLDWRGKVVHLPYDDQCKDPNDFLQHGREQELINELESLQ